jgi:opacity protein-like surface antigen
VVLASVVLFAARMTSTLLLAVLAASEVTSTTAAAPPEAESRNWAVQLSLGTPPVLGASFELGPSVLPSGLGSLGTITRAQFTTSVTLERAFGEHWTGVGAFSAGLTSMVLPLTTLNGVGVLGAHWYAKRPFDGFWVGPELMFQTNVSLSPLSSLKYYAGGARVRLGWTQPFGEHFIVSGSTGVTAQVSWTTSPGSQQSLSVGGDLNLSAGLVF